jgi:hypothetical protein
LSWLMTQKQMLVTISALLYCMGTERKSQEQLTRLPFQ